MGSATAQLPADGAQDPQAHDGPMTRTTTPHTATATATAGPTTPVTRRLDKGATAPLWQQLLSDLRHRLASGEFGSSGFPGELLLVEQYGVSRHTVREALRRLRAEGLVSVGRGRRSRVTAEGVIDQPTGIVYSLFSSVEASGMSQVSQVRRLDVHADGVVAARLGLEESTPLLYLERLRLADGLPLALDRVWLPAAPTSALLGADFTHTSLYEQLQTLTGIQVTGGQETVRAVIPSAAEHQALELTPPAAAFSVTRTACSNGTPIEWRQTLIRADRFNLTSTLRPGPARCSSADAGAAETTRPLAYTPTFS